VSDEGLRVLALWRKLQAHQQPIKHLTVGSSRLWLNEPRLLEYGVEKRNAHRILQLVVQKYPMRIVVR
jgi:hypothetical protein